MKPGRLAERRIRRWRLAHLGGDPYNLDAVRFVSLVVLSLTTDQRATLALIFSVLVPAIFKIADVWLAKRKELSLPERMRANVIIRERTGFSGNPEIHYTVNPKFIRKAQGRQL